MNKTPKRASYDDLNDDTYPIANNKHTRNANRKFLRLVVFLLAACLSLVMIYLLRSGPFSKKVDRKQDLWGYLSPYRVIQEYKNPPPECTIDQVNIVRYPPESQFFLFWRIHLSFTGTVPDSRS